MLVIPGISVVTEGCLTNLINLAHKLSYPSRPVTQAPRAQFSISTSSIEYRTQLS